MAALRHPGPCDGRGDRALVIITITDRMEQPRRIIDISAGAARKLGILRQGLALVVLNPT